jgi:hypothetical protein
VFFFFAVAALAAKIQVSADTQTLSSMFDTTPDVSTTSSGMMVVSPQVRMVMLVRRADDGSLVTTCATSAAQAEAFLHPRSPAPVEKDR